MAAALLLAPPLGACGLLSRPALPVDRTQDARITREVVARLEAEPAIDADRVRVEVDGARVVLRGAVAGLAAWQCAIANAELVEGVRSVVDYLVIEAGPREIRCLAPRR